VGRRRCKANHNGESKLYALDTDAGTRRSPEHGLSPSGSLWHRSSDRNLAQSADAIVTPPYTLVLYEDAAGREPLAVFLDNLESDKRAALVAALQEILAYQGLDVCSAEYGKNLGGGLAEFRLRHSYGEVVRRFPGGAAPEPLIRGPGQRVLLRVFFHPYGEKLILLLGGYDKGRHPSKKKQDAEIARARKRLKEFKERRRRELPRFRKGPRC